MWRNRRPYRCIWKVLLKEKPGILHRAGFFWCSSIHYAFLLRYPSSGHSRGRRQFPTQVLQNKKIPVKPRSSSGSHSSGRICHWSGSNQTTVTLWPPPSQSGEKPSSAAQYHPWFNGLHKILPLTNKPPRFIVSPSSSHSLLWLRRSGSGCFCRLRL